VINVLYFFTGNVMKQTSTQRIN